MKTKLFIVYAIGMFAQLSARIIQLPPAEFELGERTFDTSTYVPFSHPMQQFEHFITRASHQHPFYLAEVVTNATGILTYTYYTAASLAHHLHPGIGALNPVNHEPIIRLNRYRFDSPRNIIFEQTIFFAQPAGSGHHVSHTSPGNHTPPQENPTPRTVFDQLLLSKLAELQHRE